MKFSQLSPASSKRYLTIICLVLISAPILNAQLSGTKIIDIDGQVGVDADYTSITDAVADLNSQGVDAALTFNIKPGTYDEHVTIRNFPGASESNRVTFQALPADSGEVVLAYDYAYVGNLDTMNHTILFDSANYVTVKRLVFDGTKGYFDLYRIINISGNSGNLEIINNTFVGKAYGSQAANSLIYSRYNKSHDVLIENNIFSRGVYYINMGGNDASNLFEGLIIRGNQFNYPITTSVYLIYQDAPLVENNSFQNTTGICVYLNSIYNEFIIRNNKMELSGGVGIQVWSGIGSLDNPGIIANNFITNHATSVNSQGISLVSNPDRIKIYHNSVLISGASIENSGVCFYTGTTGSDVDIQNNIFANLSGGLTYYVSKPTVITNSDYNNYYSIGENISLWNGMDIKDIQDLIEVGPGDSHSISVNPGFISSTDLHTTSFLLDNKGANLTSTILTDIDGESRSTTPDIGADEFIGSGSPLSGNYTIGGVGADYANINDAVNELSRFGVSAHVNFLIRDDNSPYNEQFRILPIVGADNDKRVCFMPDPTNVNPVELICNYSKYTIEFKGAKYLTIKNLILTKNSADNSKMVKLSLECMYDSIVGCTFNNWNATHGDQESLYGSCSNLYGLVIESNRFNGGYCAVWLESSGADYPAGFRIDSNYILNPHDMGITIKGCKDFVIQGNEILKNNSHYLFDYSIKLDDCREGFLVNGNRISQGGLYAIYINNTIANSSDPGIISNNYIRYSNESYAGRALYCINSEHIGIYHNTVIQEGQKPTLTDGALILSGGSNLSVKNNIFCNYGNDVAVDASSGNLTDFSHNTIFTTWNTLIRYDGTEYFSLADLEADLGTTMNSYEFKPNFTSPGDFHTNSGVLDGTGISIPGIVDDLDGELRSDPPDIGADEFTPDEGPIPAGTYTVGGVSPDYISFTSLFNELQIRGVSGPVIFKVRKDVYPEILEPVIGIPGSSPINTVTIESESGIPEDVFLYSSTSSMTNALLTLNCVSHLTIRSITFSTTKYFVYTVNVLGRVKNLRFIDCVFSRISGGNNNVQVKANTHSLLFLENEFQGGEIGLNIEGWSQEPAEDTRIIKNHFTGYNKFYGILLNYQTAPGVLGNDILNEEREGFTGMYILNCYDGLLVNGNRINSIKSGNGISIYSCTAALPLRNLVANNQIIVGGNTINTSRGIVISSCERAGLYYNSIKITSQDTISSAGIHVSTNNTGIDLLNNNVSNSGGGYAYIVDESSAVFLSDFNNYHSTGTNLAKWVDTEVEGLTQLQNLSGKEANSLSLDPLFVSETDLHSDEMALNEKATPLAEITYDLDSLRRDPSKPDIGAFENTCGVPKFNITVLSGCLGDSTVFIDNTTGIDQGSSIGWDWDGDFVPEVYSDGMNDTIKHLFPEPGSHTVNYIVSQLLGCLDSKSLNVPVLEPPELSVETTGVYCDATDGMAAVTVLNGDGPYEYYWSNGSRENSITGLNIDYYSVTVSDSNNCSSTKDIYIDEAIDVDVVQLKKSTCGKSDGIATVTATGGYPPYKYVWTDGDTLATDSSLVAGQHFVNVIDSKGCYARGSVTIENDGSGPYISDYKITLPKCYGEISGEIDISIKGGSSPYKFKWSNGMLTEDVDNLETGIFNVSIKDAKDCIGSGSFEIIQPRELKVQAIIEDASCEGSDGKAVVLASGGTKPYSYFWSDSTNIAVASGLQAGIYYVQVSDINGCERTEPVVVNSAGGPQISFKNIQGVGCKTTNNGAIQITVSGEGPYTYEWMPGGEITANLDGLSPGIYKIKATDKNGCSGFNQAEITQAPPPVNPICLVTVDSATQMNQVVWEKINTTDVDYYNIYREGSYLSDYHLIGSQDLSTPGIFTDSIADPTIHSWRYKLSVVDVCGNESELSEHHKTIHLTMNRAIDNTVNLIWDEYEGFDVNTYNLFRSGTTAALEEIASLSSINSSFSDKIAPEEDLIYFVKVPHPTGCLLNNYKAATLNDARSNRKDKLKTGTATRQLISGQDHPEIFIYPNPGTGVYQLKFNSDQKGAVIIRIMDLSGKILAVSEINNPIGNVEYELDLRGYEDGLYQFTVLSGSNLYHRVIIKE